jgi:hypothetical protein
VEHQWDFIDARLIAVETNIVVTKGEVPKADNSVSTEPVKADAANETKQDGKQEANTGGTPLQPTPTTPKSAAAVDAGTQAEVIISTLFVATDYGIMVQDSMPLDSTLKTMMGIRVPVSF